LRGRDISTCASVSLIARFGVPIIRLFSVRFMESGRVIPTLKVSDNAREVFDEVSRVTEDVHGVVG